MINIDKVRLVVTIIGIGMFLSLLYYFINIGLIRLLLELTDINEYIAGIIATPIVAIASFVLQKHFVFN